MDPIEIARYYSEQEMPDALEAYGMQITGYDRYGDPIYETVKVLDSKCRLSGLTATEEQQAGRLASTATAKIAVPLDTQIYSDQSVKVNSEDWNIVGVLANSPSRSADKSVLIARSG